MQIELIIENKNGQIRPLIYYCMKIYVANVISRDEIPALYKEGVDMIGLNFIKEDSCYVKSINSHVGTIPNYSIEEINQRKNNNTTAETPIIKRVGSFKDDMPQTIITQMMVYKLSVIHLMGDELPLMIDNLKNSVIPDLKEDIKVYKNITIKTSDDWIKSKPFENHADALIFDLNETYCQCDKVEEIKKQLNQLQLSTPYYICGELSPAFVFCLKSSLSPLFQGIVLDKEITNDNKRKDISTLQNFTKALK